MPLPMYQHECADCGAVTRKEAPGGQPLPTAGCPAHDGGNHNWVRTEVSR